MTYTMKLQIFDTSNDSITTVNSYVLSYVYNL